MKKKDLKRHLNIYSIYKKRHTTINHAFASAISYYDDYSEKEVDIALTLLKQDPNKDLKCVYCTEVAHSWDHLNSLVDKGNFTGYGHQLGNLVPCCKICNSSKGKKNYIDFVNNSNIDDDKKTKILENIESYINNFQHNSIDINSEEYKNATKEYFDIKNEIFELMKRADEKAEMIRSILKKTINR